jgi:hypothetical protein
MRKQLVLFIVLFCCFSCASQKKEIIAKSTIKLEGRNTNIRDLIEVDGYYIQPNHPQYGNIMFFEDGTWLYFFFKKDVSEDEIKADMSSAVSWMESWGVYHVQNNTIIVNRYRKGSFWEVWFFSEDRYEVVDRETVLRISNRGLLKADESSNEIYGTSVNDTFHFTPADSLPSSDCWLKEEKWIWRNESDWKAYLEHVKQKKKQVEER